MALPLEELVKELEGSGIVSAEILKNFVPPKASPKDAEELTNELVRQKKLTRFQAEAAARGEAKSLILGNYTLLEKIGEGGMGQVFKAEHRRMKRIVAVKTLPAKTMQDAAMVARFQREVEAAAKISHPNVVAALDADEARGIHFLAMEYVEGQDLSALVKKHGPLPVEKAVNYIIQAARGLEAAHRRGIVHRDIKPANLLLDREGTIKILDMGLARIHADDDVSVELTSTGVIMGTADYMSPEQALDTRSADARADIYSLGCTLCFLVTGRAVFSGETIMMRILAHREQPIPSLRSVRPDVSAPIESVYEKMIAKKASDRYQTMAELIADLEQVNLPAIPKRASTMPPVAESDQTFVLTEREPGSTLIATPIPSRRNWLLWIGAAIAGLAIFVVAFSIPRDKPPLIVEQPKPAESKPSDSKPSDPKPSDSLVSVPVEKPPEIVETKKGPGFEQPWFGGWLEDVRQEPAEEQVEAVRKKLVELNPGFDGTVKNVIEDGRVASVEFLTDHVTDLSPVKAFRRLKSLACTGSDYLQRTGILRDLSPLQGMSLEHLNCSINPDLVELTPILKLPLRSLGLRYVGITDLSLLTGTSLEVLDFAGTRVTSLAPLQGMQLKNLDCSATQIADLSPLKGAPLDALEITGTQVTDLSPIQGAPLRALFLSRTNVTDLSPLRGMPLMFLHIGDTGASDLKPLHGSPLSQLLFHGTRVTDLSPLAGMTLSDISFTPNFITQGVDVFRDMKSIMRINASTPDEFWEKYDKGEFGTPVSSLKPITDFEAPEFQQWVVRAAEMPAEQQLDEVRKKLMELNPGFDGKLTAVSDDSKPPNVERGIIVGLRFDTNQVTDISPLRALRGLRKLACSGFALRGVLSDLSPLRGMGLNQLYCSSNLIRDLTPIKDLPLESLAVTKTQVADLSPLRGMKLKSLDISYTQVADLSPLQGMPLEELSCAHLNVSDLSPLNEAKLKGVFIFRTLVSDLQVLRGMPLEYVTLSESWVSDLSPLSESDLINIDFTPRHITKGLEVIRRMHSIRAIGIFGSVLVPPAEFWKRYDAGEFGKPLASQ